MPAFVDGFLSSNVVFISCGAEQTACITKDGKLFTFGRSQDSRLGHGETSGTNETYPRQIQELQHKNIVYVDAGYLHMACVTEDGEVWTWGKNTYHQLGHSKAHFPNCVEKLKTLGVKATRVACGRYHTVVLTDDGKVYAWGGLKSGETGTGKKKNTPEPTQVVSLENENIVDISAGQDFTLFLTADGDVYSCGAGDQGQTGYGSTQSRFHVTPTKIITLKNVTKIAAGRFHCIACTSDGQVYTWGLNREGQLGHGDTHNRTLPTHLMALQLEGREILDVAAGGGHSACIVKDDGVDTPQLFIFGRGRQGQMGRANNVESVAAYRSLPVLVDYFEDLTCKVAQVVLGTNHSAALCTSC